MSWTDLPVNYLDAEYTGLRKYMIIENQDGSVSFRDVTEYTHLEESFFNAADANSMNAAINRIMHGANIASIFSETNSYVVGDYAFYDGDLYKFTANHSGVWLSSDVIAVNVIDEVKNKANTADLGGMAAEDDAPSDGKEYGRKNGAWAEISGGGGGSTSWGGITGTLSDQTDLQSELDMKIDDAPSDGAQYARKDGQWTVVTGGGGGGGASWGEITGNLSDQTDLQNALNAKPDEDDFAPDLPSSEYISDGLYYDRSQSRYVLYQNGQAAWSMTLKYLLSTIESLKLNDAPRDGEEYVRKNGYWAVASGGGGAAAWGGITGTLSDQTDLQSALDLKANLTSLAPKLPTSGTILDGIYYDSRYDLFAIYKNGSVVSRYTLGEVLYYMVRSKAEASDVYTKTQTDNLLAEKADSSHTHDDRYYTETETDGLLANKANTSHTHDDRYYTETETDALLANKSDVGHTHDDRYYTGTETNQLLANKSDVGHTHDGRYYTETETDALLANKANTADVYSKTEADTLLSAKANTADLGGMASVDDAPSDDKDYARKNGRWSEVTSSGGGGGGGTSAILYNNTGATMLAGTIVYAEEASNRLEAHKADSVCDRRLYILNDDVADGEEVQASFVPGSIANVLCDSYAVDEGDSLVIGSTAGQATAADDNGTIGIAMGAKASGSIGIVKARLTENRTVKAVNKSATSNLPGHVYRIISGDAVGIPLAESAAKGKQPFGVQANLQSNTDGYVLLKYQPGETAMVLADSTEIQVGDWLVPSYDTPGRVRAGNGYGIGRAMTSKLAGSVGNVKCLLMPGQYGISPRCWYLPSGITEDQVLAAYQFVKRNSKAEALININNGIEYPLTENGTVEWNSETGIYLPADNSNGLIQATLNNLYTNIKSGGFGFAGVSSSVGIHGGILIDTTRTLMVNTVISDGKSTGNYSAGFSVSNTSSTAYRHSDVISAGVATADWMETPKLYLDGLSVSLSAVNKYGPAVSENSITLGHISRPANNNRNVYFTAFVLYNAYLEAAQHLELSQNIHHLGGIEA